MLLKLSAIYCTISEVSSNWIALFKQKIKEKRLDSWGRSADKTNCCLHNFEGVEIDQDKGNLEDT